MRRDHSFAVLFLAACLAASLPVLILQNIPFVDMPNHLARFAIMDALPGNAMLDEYYRVKDGFYPYYGMNLVIGALLPLVGLEHAGRIFDALAVLMPSLGAIVLSKAIHGRPSIVSLTAFALSMNGLVAWGFLNYVFSIGIVLMALGGWIASERFGLFGRSLAFAVVIFATGCIHLISAGILFGLIGAYELARLMEGRLAPTMPLFARLSAIAMLAVPVLLLFAIVSDDELGVSATAYGGLASRVDAYQSAFALGRSVPEILLGLGILVPVYIAHLKGLVTIAPRFARMLLLLIIAAMIAPVMLFGVFAVHTRLPLIIALVYLAALDYRGEHSRRWLAWGFAASAVMVAALHFVVAGAILKGDDRRISELRAAGRVIEPGTKVLPAIDYQAAELPGAIGPTAFFHTASYLVIDRSVFLPTLFGMFELGVQEKYRALFPLQAAPVSYEELSAAADGKSAAPSWGRLTDYDYLVVFDQAGKTPPPAGADLLHAGSYFKIFGLRGR